MKNRGMKIALIFILAIVAIVLINFMIFVIINNDSDSKVKISFMGFGDNTEKIFEKEYDPEQLDIINVDVSSSNVKIEKADVDNIKITAYGEKDDTIKETINEKELSINKENTKIFIFAMLYWCNEEIIIQIPNDSDEEFNINTSSGDIVATNLEINNVHLKTSSGNIECGDINNGELKSSSGDIKVGNGNEVTIQTSSGKITSGNFNILSAEASSGDIKVGAIGEATIKTSSGKISIESANKIQAEASSGDISINSIENNCNLTTNSGSIDVNSLNITENSSINAKSGNININEKNDIYVEANTKSGNEEVKENNRKSDIVLNITTTSGNINVS